VDLLVNLVPIGVAGFLILVISVALQNAILNSCLILSSPIIAIIYTSIEGKNIAAMTSQGSVSDRITFILVFSLPLIIGALGFLNSTSDVAAGLRKSSSTKTFVLLAFLALPLLQLFSVFSLRPVNGIGQSVYVPFFAIVFSIIGIVLTSWRQIALSKFVRGAEVFLLILFLFLFINVLLPVVTWHVGEARFLTQQTDDFRYSPFGSLLGLVGRNSYFENDPLGFSLTCLFAIAVFAQSKSRFFQIFGTLLAFVIGSTTQSRVFYLGCFLILFYAMISFASSELKKAFRVVILATIFLMYPISLFYLDSNSDTSNASNFSGRVFIWRVILEHWNDSGSWIGYHGTYGLINYCIEFNTVFEFYHAHNLFLQVLWDWGIFGITLMLVIVSVITFFSLRLTDGGFLLFALMLLAGIIESTFSFTILSTLFLFTLLLFRYVFDVIEQLPESGVDNHENLYLGNQR
jgi:hypothetical protein